QARRGLPATWDPHPIAVVPVPGSGDPYHAGRRHEAPDLRQRLRRGEGWFLAETGDAARERDGEGHGHELLQLLTGVVTTVTPGVAIHCQLSMSVVVSRMPSLES